MDQTHENGKRIEELTGILDRSVYDESIAIRNNQFASQCLREKQLEIEAHQRSVDILNGKNELAAGENRTKLVALKGLKEHRVAMETECDHYSDELNQSTVQIKDLEKNRRQIEGNITILEGQNYQKES